MSKLMRDSPFAGQVAVITGAASGIGAGLARHGAALGMKLVLADVDQERLKALVSDLEATTTVLGQVTDVADAGQVEELARITWQRFGGVNLLFNNAGVLVEGTSWRRSLADWQWVLGVNLWGVIHGLHFFLPRMLASGEPGHVINTSSQAGLLVGPYLAPYSATKHAVVAISETVHHELAAENCELGVSVLCPGAMATGIWESERVRPAHYGPGGALQSPGEHHFHATMKAGIAAGTTPETMAAKVFAAVRQKQFWIFPHLDFLEIFRRRAEAIQNLANPELNMPDSPGMDEV